MSPLNPIGVRKAAGVLVAAWTGFGGAAPAPAATPMVAGGRMDAIRLRREIHEAPPRGTPTMTLNLAPLSPGDPDSDWAGGRTRDGHGLSLLAEGRPSAARMGVTRSYRELGLLPASGSVGDSVLASFAAAFVEMLPLKPAMSAEADPGLVLELGSGSPVQLHPSVAGQEVDVFVRNHGAAVSVGGLDLMIQVAGGGTPSPFLAGVNLAAGTLFTPGNSAQGADAANTGTTQFWSVSVNDPSAAPTLTGGGISTKVGTVTISTLGVGVGQWSLSALLPDTSIVDPLGGSLAVTVSNTILVVVPETQPAMAAAGAALLAWALLRRRSGSGRTASSGGR